MEHEKQAGILDNINLKINIYKAFLPLVSIRKKIYNIGKMKSVEYCFIKERMLTKPSPGIWNNISATRTIYFIVIFPRYSVTLGEHIIKING